jgi:hypothetical protein
MSERTGDGSNGWARTLETANEMTDELREEGWEVVTVRAVHTAPEPPDAGESDRFGFVYVAPGDVAEAFEAAVSGGEFDGYEVFNRQVGRSLFTLTRITDADRRLAVLLVGAVDTSHAGRLEEVAYERGEMYSHVRLLDGTHLGSFHHDDAAPFFPGDT